MSLVSEFFPFASYLFLSVLPDSYNTHRNDPCSQGLIFPWSDTLSLQILHRGVEICFRQIQFINVLSRYLSAGEL